MWFLPLIAWVAPVASASPPAAPVVDEIPLVDGNPANWCRNGHFPSYARTFSTARLVAPKRVAYLSDGDGCPSAAPACVTGARAAPGDLVLVAKTWQAYTCVWSLADKADGAVGWLPTAALEVVPPVPPDWVGRWTYGPSSLELTAEGDALKVVGLAIWQGHGDNVHVGEVEAAVTPVGDRLELSSEACELTLNFAGGALVAHDNGECGGMNVRFDGVYQREAGAP